MYAKFPFRKLNKIEDNLFIDLSLIAPSRLSIYLSLKTADFRAVFFCLLRDATLARPRLASFPRQIRDTLSDRSLAYSLASQLALFLIWPS